jgi:hypothetical protein
MAQQQGCDVVLQSSSFSVPPRCSSCGSPQQTTLDAKKRKGRVGGGSVTRTFQIPYCNACAARAKSTRMKGWLFGGVTFGIAAVFAAIGLLAPGLPAVVLVVLPTILALGFAIVTMTALAPKVPAPPAMAAGDAVKLVSFDGNRSTLYCVNPMWGQEFAQANGVQPVPKSRGSWFGANSLLIALVFAPIMAGGIWFLAHPQIHIDNPGAEAMQIWLDGKQSVTVQPNANASIFVARGKHTLGYSKVGGSAPEATVEGNATMMDAHLYNPAKTGCYWLVADSYGSASVAGISQGPQAIKEFYSFDKVDTWFGDNPQSVSVSNGQTGDTRVALQRAKACMDLASRGCDEAAREQFISCQRAAANDEAFEKCAESVTCGTPKPGAATTPHTAPSGHPAAHPSHGGAPHGTPPPAPHASGSAHAH